MDVIVLHGLGRTSDIMQTMQHTLEKRGYSVFNPSYDSKKMPIKDCAALVLHELKLWRQGRENEPLYAVGHSLGALILQTLITEYDDIQTWQRVVFLGVPAKGSLLVRKLSRYFFYRWMYGQAGIEVGTYGQNLAPMPASVVTGVIAGSKSVWMDCLFKRWLGDSGHDGKILISETEVDGMDEHLILPAEHPNLSNNPGVIEQTVFFLKNGHFAVGVSK